MALTLRMLPTPPQDRELEAQYQANLAAIHEDVKELKDVGFATPRQADAVCDAKDECSAK